VNSEETRGEAPIRCDLLLTGGTVLTLVPELPVIERGYVAISGERIIAVGGPENAAAVVADRRISCRDKVVMPGLVDCHNHNFQSLGRTLGEGLTGWEWLSLFMWPYAGQITPEETLAAVYLGAVEAVLAGTTTVLDHHYGRTDAATTLAVADALEEVGLRGKVARGIAGPYTELARRQGLPESAFPMSADEELTITDECMRARPKGSKIEIWSGPINAVYTDQELLAASVELARSHGVGWHTHVSAPQSDPGVYLEAYGVRPVMWLDDQGLLGPDAVLAHTTWLDESEIEAIGSTRTAVVHCPLSNQYVPYGVMPLRLLRHAGATVGLGSDGSTCGHRQDLFENMKLLVLMHRLHHLDPKASLAPEALELATVGGAAVHGIDAGVLRPGALADVIVLDATGPHMAPFHRPTSGIVYSARASDVEMNIIGGDIVVEDGRCTLVDQDEIIADARKRAGELMDRVGLHQLAVP
jgi:5-methylthioadenosine/S-adenosylhomocysteine deaminase